MYGWIGGKLSKDVVGDNRGLENLHHLSMRSAEMVTDKYMARNLGYVSGCPTRAAFSIVRGALLEDETNDSAVSVTLPNVDDIMST